MVLMVVICVFQDGFLVLVIRIRGDTNHGHRNANHVEVGEFVSKYPRRNGDRGNLFKDASYRERYDPGPLDDTVPHKTSLA